MARRKVLAIRRSRAAEDGSNAAKIAELRAHASAEGLATTREPIPAFYNQPWMLPMPRRNEILLELRRFQPARSDHR